MPSLGRLSGRARWLVAGGAVVVAVAIVAGGLLILGSRAVPEALRYVPGDSVIVAEARLDLPGDQLSNLGNLLSHFPGFKDQSTLSTKLDQSLDQLVGDASGGALDYTTKLKPWLAGAAFIALGPDLGSGASGMTAGAAESDAVVVATTDGQVTCTAAIPSPSGAPVEDQGVQITQAADGSMACAMDGRFALLGALDRVQAALAARRNGTGIDHDPTYTQARGQLGGDQLATVFVSGEASGLLAAASALPIDIGGAGLSLPTWAIAGLRAEGDALVADLVLGPQPSTGGSAAKPSGPVASLATMPPPHASLVAGLVPGNALLVAEVHGAGVTAQDLLASLVGDPQLASQAQQVEAALDAIGGPSSIIGWVDDAAVVVLPNPGDAAGGVPGLNGGLVLVASDDATASTKTSQLVSLLSLAALSGGGNATSEQVEGTTITNIDLGDLGTLLGQTGSSIDVGGVTVPTSVDVSLSIAARGRYVLIGTDEAFPTSILAADAGQTLADLPAYQAAIGLAQASNLGQVYASGDGLRAFADVLLPADQQATWQNVQPYVAPVDALVLTATSDGGLTHVRAVLFVVTPPASPAPS